MKMDQYDDNDNSWWHGGRKNIIIQRSFLATRAKSGSTPQMNDCAKQARGCGAKIWLLENLAGGKKGAAMQPVGHKLPIRPNENSRPHIRGGLKSWVLFDDLITKIIITISRPSPVQRGLPWYLKWILALPPYLSYVQTYVTIYSPHILFVVT